MTDPKIVIGIPCPLTGGYRPFDVCVSQFQHLHPEIEVIHGMTGVVPGARNRIVRAALERKADYLWWLDDDQPFNPGGPTSPVPLSDLHKLLAHGLDAVVPLSLRRGAPFLPLLYRSIEDDYFARQRYLIDHEAGLIPIAGAGMAGLLIKTKCLTDLGADGWFEFVHPPDNFDDYAEDFPFYKKLGASGVQLYCDLDVRFGHAVTSVVYPTKQEGKWYTTFADNGPFAMIPQPVDPEARTRIHLTDQMPRKQRVS